MEISISPETKPKDGPKINRRTPSYRLDEVSTDEMIPYEIARYLGTKALIRARISGTPWIKYGGFIDYAISDKYFFVYLIHTDIGMKPFGASFDALTGILKKAGNRRILTSPLKPEGKKMLEGLEKRGYIVTKPAPKDFTSLPGLEVPKGDFPPVEIEVKHKISEVKPTPAEALKDYPELAKQSPNVEVSEK